LRQRLCSVDGFPRVRHDAYTVPMLMVPDQPRTMRLPEVRSARLHALYQPHMAPLTEFVHQLRQRDRNEYPYFDPADGGVNASILFLLEKPGPMTVPTGRGRREGSGFISRDNDDPTAEARSHSTRQLAYCGQRH
jgi:hypothetical protein